jgi:glycosyltransferase involved in cell wall biosynthesis
MTVRNGKMRAANRAQPLISVCIPVYNGENYIRDAIHSALAQSYPNIEIIVQDNASTDNTWDVVHGLAQQFPQVSLQKNDYNVGMAPNWNLAINRASGDYVMLLSADDFLEPDFLTTCSAVFQDRAVEIVTTNHYLLKNRMKVKRKISIAERDYRDFAGKVLLLNPFSINFSLFKKEAILRLKREGRLFRESFYTCDYDLWMRVALSHMTVCYLAQPLGTYRVHEANLSRQVIHMNRQAVLVILSHKRALKKTCNIVYRITLVRFMVRFIMHGLTAPMNPKRTFSILWNEFLS